MKSEVLEKSGKKVVLLGNEAIARGALEAGVGVVTAYPGTPSSEVPMVLSRLAKDRGFQFEYSVNEKIALETAAGAAWSGVRSLVAMKHFGLNVAADSLMPISYIDTNAGLVIFVADDPEAYSSVQSEQDSRYYARLAKLPMLEPANPQECLQMTKVAFELSEKFEIPVLLRTTTKVSHSIGTVILGDLTKPKASGHFEKNPTQFYNFRPQLQELHQRLNEKVSKIAGLQGQALQMQLNRVLSGDGQIGTPLRQGFEGRCGVIASGVGYEYVREACQVLNINPPIAKLGLTHPIDRKFITDFVKDKKTVLVVEELEPLIEASVKEVLKGNSITKIYGKDILPRVGEYTPEIVVSALEKIFDSWSKSSATAGQIGHYEKFFNEHENNVEQATSDIPPRKPVMCPGCPHRSTFYAIKKVFPDAIYAGDIGCYMMGVFEPFEMQDFIISMGAGLGLAHGISRVSDQEIVVFVGDSTFFHAGMPELLNYRFNNERSPLVVVMDNGITAMTGHQPNPGSVTRIEEIAKTLGAEVRVANAFNQKSLVAALKELKNLKGLRVLVSRGECRLLTRRKMRQKGQALPGRLPAGQAGQAGLQTFKVVDSREFEKSKLMEEFACPAFQKIDGRYFIDSDVCWGCTVCSQICPKGVKVVNP
jgi:indolepyruvate ferredoxin oxidoreductase alpha subunit